MDWFCNAWRHTEGAFLTNFYRRSYINFVTKSFSAVFLEFACQGSSFDYLNSIKYLDSFTIGGDAVFHAAKV